MLVEDFWKDVRRSQKCRIFPVLDGSESGNWEGQGIFSRKSEDQPIFVIDNIEFIEDGIHNSMVSGKEKIVASKRISISFEVALLEQIAGHSTNSSTVIINFFSENGNKIAEEKFSHKIFLGEQKWIELSPDTPKDAAYFSLTIFVNKNNRIKIAYSGFSLEKTQSVEESLSTPKRKTVTMTVFNNFQNDTRVLREAKSLVELGFRVKIMAIFSTGTREEEVIDGVDVSRLVLTPFHLRWIRWWQGRGLIGKKIGGFIRTIFMPLHRYLMFLEFEREVVKKLADEQSDIYHSHDLNTLRLGAKISKIHGKKLVYDSHELYLDRNRKRKAGPIKRAIIKRIERRLIRRCDKVITVNRSIADILSKRYGVEDVEVVMNTPPIQFFPPINNECNLRKILGIEDERKVAIYVGSIQSGRGIEKLLESLRFIDNVHLVLMGYGNNEILEKLDVLARSFGVTERFSVFGPVPSELVPLYTSSADVGVAPILNSCLSYYLCSPNKVFEYMHAGIPVVASNFPEMSRVVIEEEIGSVFDPEDPEDIANSMRRIFEDEGLQRRYKINSIKGSRKYNWGIESGKLQAMYMELFPNEEISTNNVANLEKNSRIKQIFLERSTGESWLEVENCLPGSRGWGSPRGRESIEKFKALLSSDIYRNGDELGVSIASRKDIILSASIYRIGHYGGIGSRKIANLGNCKVEGAGDSFDQIGFPNDEGVIEAEEFFSVDLDQNFSPGTYVLKIGNEEVGTTLPFWIFGEGEVLAIVPTIANRVHSFPNGSSEKRELYTMGTRELDGGRISGFTTHVFQNGRGGEVVKWVFPFCKWAERAKIPVSWVTDLELEKDPDIAAGFRKIVLVGDSRFWTQNMHEIIGNHISSAKILANVGCGMGEQVVEVDSSGFFEFKKHERRDEIGDDYPLCEEWDRKDSPVKFGGRTETEIILESQNEGEVPLEYPLVGSWDCLNEVNGKYIRKEISSLRSSSAESRGIEISSVELRTFSGATIFLSSMENWSGGLTGDAGFDSELSKQQRNYLSTLLTNGPEKEEDRLKTIKNSIRNIVGEEWGGRIMPRQYELGGRRSSIPIKRICLLTTIWGRDELTAAFLEHINFLKEELSEYEVTCVVVGSEGRKSEQLVVNSGNEYLEFENLPLSKKWDSGLQYTERFDPDVVIVVGSDDFLSPSTVLSLVGSIAEGRLMVGLMDMQILDLEKTRFMHWHGYSVSDKIRTWETIGLGRCLSRKLLDKVGFSIWGEESINRGLDGLMTRKLASIGMIPLPYGEEVWADLGDGIYAFGHTGIYTSDIDGFALDVKSTENITPFENYHTSQFEEIEFTEKRLSSFIGGAAVEKLRNM